MNWQGFCDYLIARGQEASTWRGAVLVITVFGGSLSDQQQQVIVMVGLGVVGAIGILFPDKK